MTTEELLIGAGMDYHNTLKRFSGNTALLERFMKKFQVDPTFGQLETAMAKKEYTEVEHAAHTLKGVSANLGFNHLSELNALLVEAVRAGDLEQIEKKFAIVAEDYSRVQQHLSQMP